MDEWQFPEDSKQDAIGYGPMTVKDWRDTLKSYGEVDEHMCPNDPWAWCVMMALEQQTNNRFVMLGIFALGIISGVFIWSCALWIMFLAA